MRTSVERACTEMSLGPWELNIGSSIIKWYRQRGLRTVKCFSFYIKFANC